MKSLLKLVSVLALVASTVAFAADSSTDSTKPMLDNDGKPVVVAPETATPAVEPTEPAAKN